LDEEASGDATAGDFLGARTRKRSPERAVSIRLASIEHESAQRRIARGRARVPHTVTPWSLASTRTCRCGPGTWKLTATESWSSSASTGAANHGGSAMLEEAMRASV